VELAGNLEGCAPWLQAEHLTADAVRRYREQFATHPARLLRVRGILRPEVADGLAAFLQREAVFERVHGIVGRPKRAPVDEWLSIDDARRLYTFERLVQPRPDFRLSPNLFAFMKVRKELESGCLREYLRSVTGLPLGLLSAFNGQSLGVGDFLRPHRDTLDRRRLAFIFYLNPDWRPEYGGDLRVLDPNDDEHLLPAEYNSLVCFDVDAHQHHEILAIHPAAGQQRRLTLGGWFLDATRSANTPPPDEPSLDRPGLEPKQKPQRPQQQVER
jgi:hypothetical protein